MGSFLASANVLCWYLKQLRGPSWTNLFSHCVWKGDKRKKKKSLNSLCLALLARNRDLFFAKSNSELMLKWIKQVLRFNYSSHFWRVTLAFTLSHVHGHVIDHCPIFTLVFSLVLIFSNSWGKYLALEQLIVSLCSLACRECQLFAVSF